MARHAPAMFRPLSRSQATCRGSLLSCAFPSDDAMRSLYRPCRYLAFAKLLRSSPAVGSVLLSISQRTIYAVTTKLLTGTVRRP